MQKSDFRKLLSYYLDCLQEEDLRSLTFNTSQLNQSFVLGKNGSFLLTGNETQFPLADSYFFKRHESNSEEPERLFLGYPIRVHEKRVSPLFFLEVNGKISKEGFISLSVADSTCCLNHHLFGKGAYDIEGPLNLQDEFECDLSNLQESLSKVFKYLGVHVDEHSIFESEELTRLNGSEPRWARNFILFRGGRSAVNEMLRKDILTFLKYPSFIENMGGTALESFLKQDLPSEHFVDTKSKFSILDDDQQKAIKAGLSQKLTVITGPPGTGKSQVVANILATCALNKKTVLFASKNNKAVDVVYEKLRLMLGAENWILRLGSREKTDECQKRIIDQLGSSQETAPHLTGINESLLEIEQQLADISNIRTQLEKQQILLNGYEVNIHALENKLDPSWINAINKISWSKKDDVVKASVDKRYRQLSGLLSRQFSYVWLKAIAFFAPARLKKYYSNYIEKAASLYIEDTSDVLSFLRQNDSFPSLLSILEKLSLLLELKYFYFERDRVEKVLLKLPSAMELKEQESIATEQQIHLYQQKLRGSWNSKIEEKRPLLYALCRRYFSTIQNPPVNREGWKKFSSDVGSLMDDFYIWIVTNLSARRSIPLEVKAFDILVIDEASQCDILSALPLLYRAKRAIIIGDPNQLKNITLINAKNENEIAEKHGVGNLLPDWSYRGKSIYDVAESKLIDSGRQPHLLSIHYRCHPDIIGFSNSVLYGNKLSTKTDIHNLQNKFRKSELGVFWHDIKGNVPNVTTSAYNQSEVDHIMRLIDSWRPSLEAQKISIGIVTPFRKQVEKLKAAIDAKKGQWSESFMASIIVGTAHRFQGDECDLIFFSPVIAPGIKAHLANWVASTEELINVAVTRARGALHVVGDETSCRQAGFLLEKLAIYIRNCRDGKGLQFGYDSPAEEIVGEILTSLELPFFTQVEKVPYRLDFIVTTPFGNKINLEVDGRQHYASEHVVKDEIRDRYITDLGYKVVRVNAKDVFTRREALIKRLSQLV